MRGLREYMDYKGWFGFVQDIMGQKLERYYHLWLACAFDGFAFVRTYLIHLLGTYVTILCNWLIL